MDKNGIFITYQYNEREIEGIEEFKKELEENYSSLGKAKYIPSFSEGGEFILKVFFESDWGTFVTGAIAGGLLWDVVKYAGKKFILKPLADAIDKLFERNKDSYKLKLVATSFIFEDIEIDVFGLSENFKDQLEQILYYISTRTEQIEKEHDCGFPIETIHLPYYCNEEQEYKEDSLSDKFGDKQFIKIIFKDKSYCYEEIVN